MKTTLLEYLRNSTLVPFALRIALWLLSPVFRLIFALTFGRLDPQELYRNSLALVSEPGNRVGVFRLLWRGWHYRIFERPGVVAGQHDAPYMLRIYLLKSEDARTFRSGDPGPYLHYFFRSDADRDLHNHPWQWALSLILRGEYREHTDWGAEDYRAGSTNMLLAGTFHRVELPRRCGFAAGSPVDRSFLTYHGADSLPEQGAWTLFLAGPKHDAGWGFSDEETGEFVPAAEYHAEKARRAQIQADLSRAPLRAPLHGSIQARPGFRERARELSRAMGPYQPNDAAVSLAELVASMPSIPAPPLRVPSAGYEPPPDPFLFAAPLVIPVFVDCDQCEGTGETEDCRPCEEAPVGETSEIGPCESCDGSGTVPLEPEHA
jgi:hypothetical protein